MLILSRVASKALRCIRNQSVSLEVRHNPLQTVALSDGGMQMSRLSDKPNGGHHRSGGNPLRALHDLPLCTSTLRAVATGGVSKVTTM